MIELNCNECALDKVSDGAIVTAYVPGVVRGSLIKIGGQIFRVVLIDHYFAPPEMFVAKVEEVNV